MSQRDLRWIKWVREGASNKKRSPAQDNPRFKFSQPKFGTLLVSRFCTQFFCTSAKWHNFPSFQLVDKFFVFCVPWLPFHEFYGISATFDSTSHPYFNAFRAEQNCFHANDCGAERDVLDDFILHDLWTCMGFANSDRKYSKCMSKLQKLARFGHYGIIPWN